MPPRIILGAAAVLIVAGCIRPAAGSVVLDMPAPPPRPEAVTAPVSEATEGSSHLVTVGQVALHRYRSARARPHHTYFRRGWYRPYGYPPVVPYRYYRYGYPGYWGWGYGYGCYGLTPWFGTSCSISVR